MGVNKLETRKINQNVWEKKRIKVCHEGLSPQRVTMASQEHMPSRNHLREKKVHVGRGGESVKYQKVIEGRCCRIRMAYGEESLPSHSCLLKEESLTRLPRCIA